MGNTNKYNSLNESDKADLVKNKYENKDPIDQYTTSTDFNLRELEIDFIIKSIKQFGKPNPKILDVGCGNGYTDLRIIKHLDCVIDGIDFSKNMINGAKVNRDKLNMKGKATFRVNNILDNDGWDLIYKNHFDIAITERLLLNLPSKINQFNTINKIYRMLKPKGLYLMIEGTKDGLERLNEIRITAGLNEILDRADDNFSSLKFDEKELDLFLSDKFDIILTKYWSIYYLFSRVIHPLKVYPNEPKFDDNLNYLARDIENMSKENNSKIGHVRGLLLQKK